MAYLVLVRHTESTWNAIDAWTGLTNISLDEKGRQKAREVGELLKGMLFDYAFVSKLHRTKQTLDEIQKIAQFKNLPAEEAEALNERDYGDLTGRNKLEVEKEYGEEQYLRWRRSWDYPVPNGETLKDVYKRVISYYQDKILPLLQKDRNILVVAHGNSLRALVKFLDNVSDEDISQVEIPTGQVLVYQLDPAGKIVSKEIRGVV